MDSSLFQWLIGIATTISLTLIGAIKILWDSHKSKEKLLIDTLEAKDREHKEDRHEWFKKLDELMDRQNSTAKQIGEAHDIALKDLAAKFDKRQGEINETMLSAFKQAFNKK